jgi:hypothetical protein
MGRVVLDATEAGEVASALSAPEQAFKVAVCVFKSTCITGD